MKTLCQNPVMHNQKGRFVFLNERPKGDEYPEKKREPDTVSMGVAIAEAVTTVVEECGMGEKPDEPELTPEQRQQVRLAEKLNGYKIFYAEKEKDLLGSTKLEVGEIYICDRVGLENVCEDDPQRYALVRYQCSSYCEFSQTEWDALRQGIASDETVQKIKGVFRRELHQL